MSDLSPEDALRVAQNAMKRVDELEAIVEEQQAEIGELDELVQGLRLRLYEFNGDSRYEELDMEDKVGIVRESAYRRANSRHTDRVALDYKDIRDLFSEWYGQAPGVSGTYRLMQQAAELDGFTYHDPEDGNKQLRADAATISPLDLSAGGGEGGAIPPEKSQSTGDRP